MRVALVGPFPSDPSQPRGGVEASFSMLVSGLATVPGVEPHVVTFDPTLVESEVERLEGVTVERVPVPRRFRNLTLHAREQRSLRAILDRLHPDVVHAQETLGYGYVCLKTQRQAPVLVSIHGIVREQVRYQRSLARARGRTAGVLLERYCIRNARFLVTPTGYAQRYFGSEIRGRVWNIDNPVSQQLFALQPSPDRGRILFSGSLIPLKRVLDALDVLPRVAADVPDAHLRVAGGFADARYTERIRTRVRELGLYDRVELLGAIGRDELLEEYRRAALLVLPSSQETSPMVIAEAMAARVPVVATRVGGVPDLVEDSVTGYTIDVGDLEALAQRVVVLLSDPVKAAAFGAAGRARADERFRPAVVAARVRDTYVEMLDSTI